MSSSICFDGFIVGQMVSSWVKWFHRGSNAYMLSFRNANPEDLDVNRRVSEKLGFIRKSEGLRKSGIYT